MFIGIANDVVKEYPNDDRKIQELKYFTLFAYEFVGGTEMQPFEL